MTARDRLVLMGVIVLAIVGGAWIMVVSPERKKATKAATAVAEAQSKLATAHGQLGSASAAQAKYASSYGTIVRLGKAVPTTQEVPSLIYELAAASKQKSVDFASISATGSRGAGAAGSSPTAKSGSGGSSSSSSSPAAAAGFQQLPFTFVFNGDYFGLERMLRQLTDFATRGVSGTLKVNGRLLTINGVTLAPAALQGHSQELTATVTATAYTLPPELAQAGTAGGGSTPASAGGGSGAPSSPTAPAVVGAKP